MQPSLGHSAQCRERVLTAMRERGSPAQKKRVADAEENVRQSKLRKEDKAKAEREKMEAASSSPELLTPAVEGADDLAGGDVDVEESEAKLAAETKRGDEQRQHFKRGMADVQKEMAGLLKQHQKLCERNMRKLDKEVGGWDVRLSKAESELATAVQAHEAELQAAAQRSEAQLRAMEEERAAQAA